MSPLGLVACALCAVALALVAYTVIQVTWLRPPTPDFTELERERREQLRRASGLYRSWEPLLDELSVFNHRYGNKAVQANLEKAQRSLAQQVPWKPTEYLACRQLEGALAGIVFFGVASLRLPLIVAALLGWGIAFLVVHSATTSLTRAAAARILVCKRRLPFAVDLMALMMEAGAGFQDALRTAVVENSKHPLGEELSLVLRQSDLGEQRSKALENFQQRIADPDVRELVAAINRGEELGTPLSSILRTQADQMRLKRSQWGEKAAAEAQVSMTFPSMLIMIACLLLVLGPFVLPAISQMRGR